MTIERTVEIPASHVLTLEILPEIPAGKAQIELLIHSVFSGNEPVDLTAYLAANSPVPSKMPLKKRSENTQTRTVNPFPAFLVPVPVFLAETALPISRKYALSGITVAGNRYRMTKPRFVLDTNAAIFLIANKDIFP
jgi:hypothetical protein